MTRDDIIRMALEACEQRLPLKGQAAIIDELNALRAALAEPVQHLVDPAEYDDFGAAERYNRGLK